MRPFSTPTFIPSGVSIHAPVRVRLDFYSGEFAFLSVSIHAPVRVRQRLKLIRLMLNSFNSRTREGATKAEADKADAEQFQFTHP